MSHTSDSWDDFLVRCSRVFDRLQPILSWFPSKVEKDEVINELFLHFRVKNNNNPDEALIYTVARGKLIDLYRREKRKKDISDFDLMSGNLRKPSSIVNAKEEFDLFIDVLDPAERSIFEYLIKAYIYGDEILVAQSLGESWVDELARSLNVTSGAIYKRISRMKPKYDAFLVEMSRVLEYSSRSPDAENEGDDEIHSESEHSIDMFKSDFALLEKELVDRGLCDEFGCVSIRTVIQFFGNLGAHWIRDHLEGLCKERKIDSCQVDINGQAEWMIHPDEIFRYYSDLKLGRPYGYLFEDAVVSLRSPGYVIRRISWNGVRCLHAINIENYSISSRNGLGESHLKPLLFSPFGENSPIRIADCEYDNRSGSVIVNCSFYQPANEDIEARDWIVDSRKLFSKPKGKIRHKWRGWL